MILGYVIVYTKDVLQSVEFYERAFGLMRRFVHESSQYAEMDTGATALTFVSDELATSNLSIEYRKNQLNGTGTPAGIEVALVSEDVNAAYKHAVANGAKSIKEPVTKPWGQIVGYVLDNNGVLIEIASPMG